MDTNPDDNGDNNFPPAFRISSPVGANGRRQPQTFHVLCGDATVAAELSRAIMRLEPHLRTDENSPVKVIVDMKRGCALDTLAALPPVGSRDREEIRVVVLTTNRCPEYLAYLLEMDPQGLIVDPSPQLDLSATAAKVTGAITHAARGYLYLIHPREVTTRTPLSTRQLAVLRWVAAGCSNKEIAKTLGVSDSTVSRDLAKIFQELGVPDRSAAALYFWGDYVARE